MCLSTLIISWEHIFINFVTTVISIVLDIK